MAGRHAKYFKDPFRVTSRPASDEFRDNFDKIDWKKPESQPESRPESKPRIMAPGPVFRMELNDLPQGVTLKDIMEATLKGETPEFVKTIEQGGK